MEERGDDGCGGVAHEAVVAEAGVAGEADRMHRGPACWQLGPGCSKGSGVRKMEAGGVAGGGLCVEDGDRRGVWRTYQIWRRAAQLEAVLWSLEDREKLQKIRKKEEAGEKRREKE